MTVTDEDQNQECFSCYSSDRILRLDLDVEVLKTKKKGEGCSPLSNMDEPQKVILSCFQACALINECGERCNNAQYYLYICLKHFTLGCTLLSNIVGKGSTPPPNHM